MNLSALAAALARLLTPSKNFPGLTGLGFAAYALAQSLAYGHSIGDPRVWQPALAAFLAFMGRQFVTPVADPRVPGKLITDLTPPLRPSAPLQPVVWHQGDPGTSATQSTATETQPPGTAP